jgi:hypothetical protein
MVGLRWLGVAILGILVAACGGGGDDGGPADPPIQRTTVPTPKDKLALSYFSEADDCAEFRSYAADGLTEQYLQPFYQCLAIGTDFAPCPLELTPPTDVAAPGEAAGGNDSPGRVSQTNTQEQGVDEADIVKADSAGNLYILAGKTLFVVDAFPADGLADRPLASLDLSNGNSNFYASDFFLDEATKRLVVLAQSYGAQAGAVVNVIVDITNPAQPAEVKRIALDGYSLEARRIGPRVHHVSRFDVPLPAWFHDAGDPLHENRVAYNNARSEGDEEEMAAIKAATRAEIGERIDVAGADSLLPRLRDGNVDTVLGCGDVARPDVPAGLGLAVIDSFNTNGSGRAVSAAINNGWMVYASANNIYLAQSSFGWRFDALQSEESAIWRFTLSNSGAAAYQGVGKVPGTLGGPYAMSEHEGHLRVATTETRFTSTPDAETVTSYNQLRVLRANVPNADLDVVGAVSDFAPGERIQGVRFLGERGFVVTFRNIDPLFAFDLSNPALPTIESALHIPGFSSYLAPLGDDYLLTVGREGTEDGVLTGRMKIALYDVSNLANVQEVATLVPGDQPTNSYSYSAAEYDPHAFTFFPDDPQAPAVGTLAIPLQSYGEFPEEQFAGFVVVGVDGPGNSLVERGRVNHASLATERFCGDESPEGDFCSPAIYSADPRRAVFMEDGDAIDLFTISLVGIVASNAAAPDETLGTKLLPFDPPPFDYCCAGGGGGVEPAGS